MGANEETTRRDEVCTGHKPIPMKIANKVMKSICKITIRDKNGQILYGTGFFMNISNSLKYLITNYHIINPKMINNNIEIEIWNQEIMKLNLNNRYTKYLEKPKDITIIEINNKDKIYNNIEFLNYDNNYINGYIIYKNVDVFSIEHPYGDDAACASGKIININEFEFDHNISTDNGSSGCPIILLNNNINLIQVIGIHKNSDDKKKLNGGTFIGEIFNEIKNNNNYIIAKVDINDKDINKEIRIINSYEEFIREHQNDNEMVENIMGELYNEEDIKKCEIRINNEIIPFNYFYKFPNNGVYLIEYTFNNILTKTSFMFSECKSLMNIDLSYFNTKKVTNMDSMFYGCKSLHEENIITDDIRIFDEKNFGINENKGKGLLNILILGREGTSRNILVNLLNNPKSNIKERETNTTRYRIKKYNICFYNFNELEFDSYIKQITILLNESNRKLTKKRNQIHLIFYLIDSKWDRELFNMEKKLFKVLIDYQIQTFFLLNFGPDKETVNESKKVFEKELRIKFYEFYGIDGSLFFVSKAKVLPVHLPEKINLFYQNFGLKTVLEEAYNKFKNYMIDDDNINQLKYYLKNSKESIIDSENKEKIFDILTRNENILYKYIKDIDDKIYSAIILSKLDIDLYSNKNSILGSLGFLTVPMVRYSKKNLLLKIAKNFGKVTNDEDKDDLVRINSGKIDMLNLEISTPVISIIGNYKDTQAFGKYFIDKYEKELNEEGINGLSKYLIDLINSYNTAIKGLKEFGNTFNK